MSEEICYGKYKNRTEGISGEADGMERQAGNQSDYRSPQMWEIYFDGNVPGSSERRGSLGRTADSG